VRAVAVAVAESRPEENHGVVEDRGFAFLHGLQLAQQISVLRHVPAVDQLILPKFVFCLSMMRGVVMSQGHAVEKTEADIAHGIAEHERADARGVALESSGDHVEHQFAMLLVAARLLRGSGFGLQLDARLPVPLFAFRRALYALFDRAHDREVLIQPGAIGGADFGA